MFISAIIYIIGALCIVLAVSVIAAFIRIIWLDYGMTIVKKTSYSNMEKVSNSVTLRLLINSDWEAVCENGKVFRTYSHIWTKNNEWTMQDGTPASTEEALVMNSAIENWCSKNCSTNPWK